MTTKTKIFIAVIGGDQPTEQVYNLAEEVGYELALRDAVVICGGLGGVMEAACKGAKKAGGLTVGMLPRAKDTDANPYVDVPIVTDIGFARNIVVVQSGMR